MKFLKIVAGICAAIALVGSLSGCVVVPGPYRYGPGPGPYYHHYYR